MHERRFLTTLFDAALQRAAPAICVPPHLPPPPAGRTVVVGAGKAAAFMAQATERHWPADAPLDGVVVTRYGHGAGRLARIGVIEAAHPVPDAAGAAAASRMLALVAGLGAEDLVLALISGGGSALLGLPAPGVSLADEQAVARALLRSGVPIGAMNCVRRQLSAIKGGRLALAAAPARVVTLVISDVPGDDPAVVASGPTVPGTTTQADALAVLARWGIAAPAAVLRALHDPAGAAPLAGDPAFARNAVHVVGSARDSLAAAADAARAAGIAPVLLGDALEGDAAELGRTMAARALQAAQQPGPCVLLSGGETTVRVRGPGRGGRNTHFLLALALALGGHPRIHALAADTDGIDGTEDNAGAWLGPATLARAAAAGLDGAAMLAACNSHGFFAGLDDLLHTGPTGTNVNDFRAVLITA